MKFLNNGVKNKNNGVMNKNNGVRSKKNGVMNKNNGGKSVDSPQIFKKYRKKKISSLFFYALLDKNAKNPIFDMISILNRVNLKFEYN